MLIPTRPPFSFEQALTFISRFPACRCDTILERDRVSAAFAIDGKAYAFSLSGSLDRVTVEVHGRASPAITREVARRATAFLGAGDDLAPFYRAAVGDAPLVQVIGALHGLHHVRFLAGLAEIAVYCVLMQRTPPDRAARAKEKFLARFGLPVSLGDRELRAMPELAQLAELDVDAIAGAIGNRPKAARIVDVVRGVAALGETFLRTASYADATSALLEIPGVGPFSADAILLRGLGRMQEVRTLDWFADDARAIYGPRWNAEETARRYREHIGYWTFYVKTGAARMQP